MPGLVTRMTTDITNVQNAFMMIIRMAVRSPLSLIFSYIMCLMISPTLSMTFLIALGFLVLVLGGIMIVTMKIFNEAVSYTHLDVYKRQALCCGDGSAG